jgi:hypothetical protein
MRFVPLLLVMAALAVAPPRAQGAAAAPLLAKVFQPDMLGARVAYFEHMAGPAWRIEGRVRRYRIGDCVMSISALSGIIRSMSLELNESCTVSLDRFVGVRLPSANQMTFGDLDRVFQGRFYADCLALCSNRADPVVSEHFRGPHALNFVEIKLQAALVDDASVKAAGEWADTIAHARGARFVAHRGFNCTDRFDGPAHSAFHGVKLTAITIGEGLPVPRCGGQF